MLYDTLVILISNCQISTIKNGLLQSSRQIPQVKSSHLSEALAHALGFSKEASLKATFTDNAPSHFVEFREDAFWARLSELSGLPVSALQESFTIDLPRLVSRATGALDLRQKSPLSPQVSAHLDRLFEVMAEQGVARYFFKVGRMPKAISAIGYGGFFRMEPGMMRPAFQQDASGWGWNKESWNAVIADDILTDHCPEAIDISSWAAQASTIVPDDVELRTIVFSAESGLIVEHGDIDGCEASILHQRKGQLAQVRDADAHKLKEKSPQPA